MHHDAAAGLVLERARGVLQALEVRDARYQQVVRCSDVTGGVTQLDHQLPSVLYRRGVEDDEQIDVGVGTIVAGGNRSEEHDAGRIEASHDGVHQIGNPVAQ